MTCGCIWHQAAEAADHILVHGLGVSVAKQLDPVKDADFITITNRLRRQFVDHAGPIERRHVQQALNELDVDWVNMSAAQRSEVVRAANLSLRGIPEAVLPGIRVRMSSSMRDTIGETKVSVADRFNLDIRTSLDQQDLSIVRSASTAQSTFATDVYGQRRLEFSAEARAIVADGLEQGLRSPEIARNLSSAAVRINLQRSEAYWQVVSSSAVNRARTYGQLRSFDDAEIRAYRFDAVLDERTTNICRMMDGQMFPVRSGLSKISQVEDNGEDVKQVQPWVRQRRNEEGKIEMFVQRGEAKDVVGVVEESAVGQLDEVGRFSNTMTTEEMIDAGVIMPPLHGLCRSTVLPVF